MGWQQLSIVSSGAFKGHVKAGVDSSWPGEKWRKHRVGYQSIYIYTYG